LKLGNDLMDRGGPGAAGARLDEASAACRKAIALSLQNVGAWLNLGMVCSRRGDLDGAVEAYRQAASIDPSSPEGAQTSSLRRV
jgi:Flp pilus assembly protein TadD